MNTEPSRPQDLPRSLEELRTRFLDDLRSGVEVPVEMELMLSADPEGASEPPNSKSPAPAAVPK